LIEKVQGKSVPRLFAYGLFSMIPLVAAVTRFHLLPTLEALVDRKKSLILLRSICNQYETLHTILREAKTKQDKKSTHPIYKTAFEFKKYIVSLANYAKLGLRAIRQEEDQLELLELQTQASNAAADRERRQATLKPFEAKRDRLLALWNFRQSHEINMNKRLLFGSAGIDAYLKTNVRPDGYVVPTEEFDFNKLAWSPDEIACLQENLKKFYGKLTFDFLPSKGTNLK
jgi:hypothetical protein